MEPTCAHDPDAVYGMNPLEIDLVLTKIFQCLRRNTLLTCRLVNQTWNSIVVPVLRSRNWTISLDGSNIKEYLTALKQCNRDSNGGDENDLDGPQPNLNISFTYAEETAKSSNGIIDCATELVNLRGPKCIHAFTLKCLVKQPEDLEHSEWIRVLKLIQTISPGLRELVISVHAKPENFSSTVALDEPSFPELQSLAFGQVHISPTVLAQILNSAPKLKNLTVTRRLFDMTLDGRRITNSLSAITSLHNVSALRIDAVDYLNAAFLPAPLDNVRDLTIRVENGVHDISTDFVSQFIRSKCSNLTSLEFEFVPTSNSFTNSFPLNMPTLPKLTHLGYKVNWSHCLHKEPSFIKLDNLMMTPQKFPALQSVTTNMGSCVYLSSEFDEWQAYQLQEDQNVAWYNNPFINSINFAAVSTLHFVINYAIDFQFQPDHIGFPISLKESINQIHVLYPSIKKLHIDNQITTLTKEKCKIILKTLLEEIDGIMELVISNYDHDWLGEVISDTTSESPDVIPDLITKVQSLRNLRLPPLRRLCDHSTPSLDLNAVLKHIPELREIQVDARFLQNQDDEPFESVQLMLEKLKSTYPNCDVKLF